MAERNILLLDNAVSPWGDYLEQFFEDTRSRIHRVHDGLQASSVMSKIRPDIFFLDGSLVTLAFGQKLKVWRQTNPGTRLFLLSPLPPKAGKDFPSDDIFEAGIPFEAFRKKLVSRLPMPEKIRLLVVDDEREIGDMVADFLKDRTAPAFEVDYACNGAEGLEAMMRKRPDILLLDIKMPVKDGREVYREIREKGETIPVIVFFDAISGEEIAEIRSLGGKAAVLEKCSRQSAMPEMLELIKKTVYFG